MVPRHPRAPPDVGCKLVKDLAPQVHRAVRVMDPQHDLIGAVTLRVTDVVQSAPAGESDRRLVCHPQAEKFGKRRFKLTFVAIQTIRDGKPRSGCEDDGDDEQRGSQPTATHNVAG